MSLLSNIWKKARGAIGTAITAFSPVAGGILGAAGVFGSPVKTAGSSIPAGRPMSTVPMARPGGTPIMAGPLLSMGTAVGGSLARGALPAVIGRGAGLVVGRGIGMATTAARSAMTYCRRHPAWCASIGGLAAVESMIGSGQLPPIKRRRRKGISASDLSKFRRVASFLYKWGPMCQGARKPRRGK